MKINHLKHFLHTYLPVYQFIGIIFILKTILVLWIGFHYEQDTPRYLLNIRHLYNPPLYSIVLRIITRVYPNLYLTITLQTWIFALIITFFSFRQKQNQLLWALFWAIEPFSTFYCSNLMSEWLFIALLFAAYSEWKIYQLSPNYLQLTLLVFIMFLLYMTRYVGITFFIFFLIFSTIQLTVHKKILPIKHLTYSILLFFIFSIPIRIIHYYTFQTLTISAYDGLNLWNSVSVLYPGSETQKKPQSDFEKFLITFPDSIFSTENALFTNQMWLDTLPANQYANQKGLSPTEMNTILKNTSYRLIKQEPWILYLQRFIIPNLLKPFLLKRENIGIQGTYTYLEKFFGKHKIPDFQYPYEGIVLLFLVILMNFFLKKTHFLNLYLIFYWLMIILSSAIFMRYLYAILPLALYSTVEIINLRFTRPSR